MPQVEVGPMGLATRRDAEHERDAATTAGYWANRWHAAALVLILLHTVAALGLALHLEITYYDSYDYLVIARGLVRPPLPYPAYRPPLYPILLVPFALSPPDSFAFAHGPAVLAVGLTALLLLLAHRVYRRSLSPVGALLGVVVLIGSPLVVHYGPFPVWDIPSAVAFLLLAALYGRARTGQRRPAWALAGTAAGTLFLFRPTLAALAAAPWLTEMLLAIRDPSARDHLRDRRFWFWMGLWPAVVGSLGQLVPLVQGTGTIAGAVTQLARVYRYHLANPPFEGTDVWYELPAAVPVAISVPLTLIAVAAAARGIYRLVFPDLFFASAVGTLLAVHMAVVGHNETRYLTPVLPALAYFAARGLESVLAFGVASSGRGGQAVAAPGGHGLLRPSAAKRWAPRVAVVLLLLPLAASAAREWRRFGDTIFWTPFWRQVGAYLRDPASGRGPLYFTGHPTPLFPARVPRHGRDNYFCIFHFGRPQLYLLSGRVPQRLEAVASEMPPDALRFRLAAQEATVVPLCPMRTGCRTLPASPPGLVVHSPHITEFQRASTATAAARYRSGSGEEATLIADGQRTSVEFGQSLPPTAQLYRLPPEGPPEPVPVLVRSDKAMQVPESALAGAQRFFLVWTEIKRFPAPEAPGHPEGAPAGGPGLDPVL